MLVPCRCRSIVALLEGGTKSLGAALACLKSWYCNANRATSWKASSTLMAVLALVSKWGSGRAPIPSPCEAVTHQFWARSKGTARSLVLSHLFPTTTKGNCADWLDKLAMGPPTCWRNSPLQWDKLSSECGSVVSYVNMAQSAPR